MRSRLRGRDKQGNDNSTERLKKEALARKLMNAGAKRSIEGISDPENLRPLVRQLRRKIDDLQDEKAVLLSIVRRDMGLGNQQEYSGGIPFGDTDAMGAFLDSVC